VASTDTEKLLELHARERRAHLEGDATLLTSGMADHVWESSRGGLNRLSRSDLEERFTAYFRSVRYTVWDDLEAPHVAVSADGSQAWMAVVIEARLVDTADDGSEHERGFESSWIAAYEKQDDDWKLVGIGSSVVDRH
jgi:hypothetical protein